MLAFHGGHGNKRRLPPLSHEGTPSCAAALFASTRYYIHRDEYRSEQGEEDRSSSTSNGTLVFWKRATSPRRSSNPAISVPHNLPDCIPPRRRIIPLVLSFLGLYPYWCILKERRGERANRENSTFSRCHFCAACNSETRRFYLTRFPRWMFSVCVCMYVCVFVG